MSAQLRKPASRGRTKGRGAKSRRARPQRRARHRKDAAHEGTGVRMVRLSSKWRAMRRVGDEDPGPRPVGFFGRLLERDRR